MDKGIIVWQFIFGQLPGAALRVFDITANYNYNPKNGLTYLGFTFSQSYPEGNPGGADPGCIARQLKITIYNWENSILLAIPDF